MFFIMFLLILIHILAKTTATPPRVNIDSGHIIGQRNTYNKIEVNEYLSVPYAKPPVGKLRFQKPKPLPFLKSSILATRQPPACPQYSTNPYPWYYNGTEKSEDCLYLNIWAPGSASPTNRKAVFYFIHGGGYRLGSIRQSIYNGVVLSALGDVVVVNVNYRVGPFGFLYSGTKDSPGNVGLWDALLGLEWVNRYIHAFGGDPSMITLAGESVGAIAVGIFSLTPLAKGLYARMVMQSNAPVEWIGSKDQNLDTTQQLATLVGCANDTYTIRKNAAEITKCLRTIDYEILSKAESTLLLHTSVAFLPIFGDELMPVNPKDSVNKGNFNCPELLIGVNQDEGSLFVSTNYPDIFGFFGEKDPHINRSQAATIIGNLYSHDPEVAESVVHHYLPRHLEDDHDTFRQRSCNAFGDFGFTCPVSHYAQKCAEKGKVYYFYWRHRPSTSPWAEWENITHMSEVEFVFGRPLLVPQEYSSEELNLSERTIKIWADFVKYGSPSNTWPLYSKSNQVVANLAISAVPPEEKAPRIDNCRFIGKISGYT